uniref:Uncharacterized protein n=1 Tax=Arundo donax TaxID=35708 RepID=A0A0A9ADA4_ARUDO
MVHSFIYISVAKVQNTDASCHVISRHN